jgi:hypothetical protein
MVPNEFQAFYPVVRIRIDSPHPLTRKRVSLPSHWVQGGRHANGGGGGGLKSDDGTDTLLFWLYYDPSTHSLLFVFRLSLWQVTFCLCVMPVKQLDRRLYQSVGFKFFIQPSKDAV